MAASMTTAEPAEGQLPALSSRGQAEDAVKPSPQSQTVEALEDIVYGSVAGALGKVLEYPFDTVKVRLQSQDKGVYKNSLDCFQQSVRSDGLIRGLYRGLSAPVFGAAVETSSLFFSYRLSQDFLLSSFYRSRKGRDALPMDALLIAGAASGAATSIFLTPIELVKCQMQVPLTPGSTQGPGIISIIGAILRHNGPLGFWHGQLGTLIREAGGSAAWFGAYEGAKKYFKEQNTRKVPARSVDKTNAEQEIPFHIWQRLVAGACAGVAYNFTFFPADTIKSRMQTMELGPGQGAASHGAESAATAAKTLPGLADSSRKTPKQPDFWTTGKALWKEAGLRGLYRGCAITLTRSTISSPIIFGIYEMLKSGSGS